MNGWVGGWVGGVRYQGGFGCWQPFEEGLEGETLEEGGVVERAEVGLQLGELV